MSSEKIQESTPLRSGSRLPGQSPADEDDTSADFVEIVDDDEPVLDSEAIALFRTRRKQLKAGLRGSFSKTLTAKSVDAFAKDAEVDSIRDQEFIDRLVHIESTRRSNGSLEPSGSNDYSSLASEE